MNSPLLDVVTAFRGAGSAAALVAQAPEVIARLGFDRVLVSRVDDGVWLPESMFVRHDPDWAAAIVEAGRSEVVTVESVVETDVVAAARTLVVDDVQSHPRVCHQIAAVSRSDNYGVAPITVDATVVGMVHADCYLQGRAVRRAQCDALAVAAESLAAHLGRLLLVEQLRAVRAALAPPSWAGPSCIAQSWVAPSGVAPSGVAPSRTGPAIGPEPAGRAVEPATGRTTVPAAGLTGRELDVMRLMAAGATNYRIARQLNISEGTVKTHVSRILHKLDAASRTQAVSRWLGQAPTDRSSQLR